MKIKRLKKANRVLTFYRYNYDYLSPYSVVLDGTFCQAALTNKINLREQLPKYLSETVNISVTKCVLNELEQLGTQVYGALAIAKNFETAKCPHNPIRTAADCLKHLARRSKTPNHLKYFIGTQDDKLLKELREIGGIPLISIRFNTILLEKPSQTSVDGIKTTNKELESVKKLKKEVLGELEENKRKRKTPKAPNPLSCKKKKKKPIEQQEEGKTTKKKTRKRFKKRKENCCSESNVIEI